MLSSRCYLTSRGPVPGVASRAPSRVNNQGCRLPSWTILREPVATVHGFLPGHSTLKRGTGICRAQGGDEGFMKPDAQMQRLRRFMRNVGLGDATSNGGAPQNANQNPRQSLPPAGPTSASDAVNEWGSDWADDWDPSRELNERVIEQLSEEAGDNLRKRTGNDSFRDKWITPLLDADAVGGAVDPDQERTEDLLENEALANKDESQTALRFAIQLITLPLITGFLVSRALADPVLSFTLQNNPDAFAMTDRQKIEGAEHVHMEETRVRFDMAIGKAPPLSEEQLLEHLREVAEEIVEEERHGNEEKLITVVSDSTSSAVIFALLLQRSRGRTAFFNTFSRLFDGLSDIAKAILIILVTDTLLGYHSEEGWTGLVELAAGHYGFEPNEEALVVFVGTIPVLIDVAFKYWVFIGLNKISPGAVVTIKAIDTD